jgi:YesN/AraC family two-component response regulator
MADVTQALHELGITEWVLRGEPTNSDEFASMFTKVIGTTENNTAIESDNSADWPEGLDWDAVETKMNELTAAEPMKELRAERDRLIAATDWWASSDLTMTEEQTAYRQALRDITEDYSSLDDVEWPDKP